MRFEKCFLSSLLILFSISLKSQLAFSGLFQDTGEEYRYANKVSWQEFEGKQKAYAAEGFFLKDLETAYNPQQQFFWGIWQKGEQENQVHQFKSWMDLVAKKKSMSSTSWFLSDVEAYQTAKEGVHFIGVWQKGPLPHKVIKVSSWQKLLDIQKLLLKENFRMQDIEVLMLRNQEPVFVALFYKGRHDQKTYLVSCNNWECFGREKLQRNKSGYHLMDFESFQEGGSSVFVGLFTKGNEKEVLKNDLDEDSFIARQVTFKENRNLQLVELDVFPGNGVRVKSDLPIKP